MNSIKTELNRDKSVRDNNMDLLRLLSCFSVVLIHVNAQYFVSRSTTPSLTSVYVIESLINIVTRFSVPAFVMISGSFILSKRQNANALIFYRKSFKKVFLPLIPAVFFFAVYDRLLKGVSLIAILEALVNGTYYNLWFMFMLLCLYALVPILVKLKAVLPWHWWGRLGCALLFWAIVSQATSAYALSYDIGIVASFLGYFIIGNFLHENYHDLKLPSLPTCVIIISLLVIVTFFVRYFGFSFYSFNAYRSFFSPSIVVISLLIFIIFCNGRISLSFKNTAKLTYYVYVFHTLVYTILMQFIGNPAHELRTIVFVFALTILISFTLAKLYSILWRYLWRICSSKPTSVTTHCV